MKKFGFTLSEVIVALGIIGLVAAITAPMMEGVMPDSNKTKVLKYYKIISEINKEMLNDRGLYREQNTSTTDPLNPLTICRGFACTQAPTIDPYKGDSNYSGSTKYAYLLASKMQLAEDEEPVFSKGSLTFTTIDGVQVNISTMGLDPLADGPQGWKSFHNLTLDLDGEDGGCHYDKDDCKKPDQFRFTVQYNGRLKPEDALTNAYIKNPHKLNDRKKDFEAAKTDTAEYKFGFTMQAVDFDHLDRMDPQ